MMKKKGSRKGLDDRKRGAKRNEGEIEHLKRRTRPLKRKCDFRIPVVLQDREHGFEILSQKTNSHKVRTRFVFL